MRLLDKVAIITGAGSGIGRASAILFAQEGARVVAADIHDDGGKETVKCIKDNGGEAIFVHTDVAISSQANDLIQTAIKKYSKIDILLNSAGLSHKHLPIEKMDDELWDRVYGVNVKGILHTMKYTIPYMQKARYGSIVNVAAGAGVAPWMPNCSAYASSKGAVIILTKAAALELAPYTVRANVINPSGTDTPMLLQYQEVGIGEKKSLPRTPPLGRLIKPEEVAYAALFLASDESLMLSGTSINVNAGEY
jgi:3-oxoacyl-[acyl-carrier protein] reductase